MSWNNQLTTWQSVPQSDALRIVADSVRAEPPAHRRPQTITYVQPTSQAVARVPPTSRVIAAPPPRPIQLRPGETLNRQSMSYNGGRGQVDVHEGRSRRDGSHAKYTHATTYTGIRGKETIQVLEYDGPTGCGQITKRTYRADDSSDDEEETYVRRY
jgi:hypothetical protein